MLQRVVRIAGGTAALVAGGWLLRALHGAPAALGAGPADIAAVANGSPHFQDGVFLNIEPAAPISLTREERWKLLHDMFGGTSQRPDGDIPVRQLAVIEALQRSAITQIILFYQNSIKHLVLLANLDRLSIKLQAP